MRQIGYQQQFQVQQQRIPHFLQPGINSQRVATLPSEISSQPYLNSQQVTRRSMYGSPVSGSQSQPPRMIQPQIQPQNQRFNSPPPQINTNSSINSSLSNSNLSLINNQPQTVGLTTPKNQTGAIYQSVQSPSAASLNTSMSSQQQQSSQIFSKSLQGTFSSHTAAQGLEQIQRPQSAQNKQNLILDQYNQVKILKEELGLSRALCASTQKHNDELIQKIKVLIKENEKIQQKEQQEAEQIITRNEAGNPPNIQLLMLENKRFLGVIRDLESKTKLLMLENEKQLFLLKQAQILQSKNQNKPQAENTATSNQPDNKLIIDQGESSKEDYHTLQKKLELQQIELKNYLGISQSLEKKIDLLLGENEKLQKITKEKLSQNESLSSENKSLLIKLKELRVENQKLQAIIETSGLPEQQVVQMESNFQAILEENKRISELLSEKTAEVDRLQKHLTQFQAAKGDTLSQASSNFMNSSGITSAESIGKLTVQNQHLLDQIESLSKEVQSLQNEKIELKSLCDSKHRELEINKEKVSYLEHEVISLKSDDLKERYVALQGYISETKMRVNSFENAWKLEKEEIQRCHKLEQDDANKRTFEISARLEEINQKCLKSQAEIRDYQAKLQSKQSEENLLKVKVNTISEQMERCRMEMDEVQKQYFEKQMELSKKQAEADTLTNQLILAQNDKMALSNESTRVASLNKTLQEKLDSVFSNLKESRNELQKVQGQNQQLQQEIANMLLNSQKQVNILALQMGFAQRIVFIHFFSSLKIIFQYFLLCSYNKKKVQSLEDKILDLEKKQNQNIQLQLASRFPSQHSTELSETLKRLVSLEKEMQSKIYLN